jgi:large subunit ribosomal protein L21
MYAIVKVGGKQYRVEKGDTLVVDRMPDDEGAKVSLEPLMFRGDGKDDAVFSGDDLGKVKVEATITGHLRGKKIHVLKFKPKRGYKRRQGHRSELTKLEIGDIKLAARKPAAAKPKAEAAPKPRPAAKPKPAAKKPAAKKPAAKKPAAKKPAAKKPVAKKETSDGS